MHGGAGGIGTFAIQLATALGARVLTTAGSPEKLELCAALGADLTIDYQRAGLRRGARRDRRHGADVILDNMGAKYLGRNVYALATHGRLVVIGMQGGTKGELDLGTLLRKRGSVDRDHAAGAAARGEGGDLRRGRRARLAAGGRRARSGRSSRPRSRWRRPAGPRADGVGRVTAARSC